MDSYEVWCTLRYGHVRSGKLYYEWARRRKRPSKQKKEGMRLLLKDIAEAAGSYDRIYHPTQHPFHSPKRNLYERQEGQRRDL